MTKNEALELLELEDYASAHEIESAYRKLYNEYQIRITNAPTASQRSKFQEKLKELDKAYTVLKGDSSENIQSELPSMTPITDSSSRKVETNPKHVNITIERAKEVLGVPVNFIKKELDEAYQSSKISCEASISNAFNAEVEQAYRDALAEIEQAYKMLISEVSTQAHAPNVKANQKSSKKTQNSASSGLIMGIPKRTVLLIGLVLSVVLSVGYWGLSVLGIFGNLELKNQASLIVNELEQNQVEAGTTLDHMEDIQIDFENIFDDANRQNKRAMENDLDQLISSVSEASSLVELIQNDVNRAIATYEMMVETKEYDEGLNTLQIIEANTQSLLNQLEECEIKAAENFSKYSSKSAIKSDVKKEKSSSKPYPNLSDDECLELINEQLNKDNHEALKLMNEMASRFSANTYFHYTYGTVLMEENDFYGAEKHLKKSIQIDPYHSDALYQLGALYLNTGIDKKNSGETEKAKALFNKSLDVLREYLEVVPNDDEVVEVMRRIHYWIDEM